MNLPDVFHFYCVGFLGIVIVLWSWEKFYRAEQRKKKEVHGKCPICDKEWRSEVNLFQKRCEKCGFRLKLPRP